MSVATFGAVVPPALLSPPLCAVLELARLGRWLQPPAELEGRSVALTLTDLGLRHGLCCRDGRFRPHGVADAELSLSASLADVLLLLAGQVDADTLFFQRRLAIAGDTELGLVVKNALDALELPVLDPSHWSPRAVLQRKAPHLARQLPALPSLSTLFGNRP